MATEFLLKKDLASPTFPHHTCRECPNVSTTPITAMGFRQCLPLSVVQLKGKHCRKPHCCNGVVDTFRHCDLWPKRVMKKRQDALEKEKSKVASGYQS